MCNEKSEEITATFKRLILKHPKACCLFKIYHASQQPPIIFLMQSWSFPYPLTSQLDPSTLVNKTKPETEEKNPYVK